MGHQPGRDKPDSEAQTERGLRELFDVYIEQGFWC